MTGTVTLDGQPLTQGRVQFYGSDDKFFTTGIDPDGTFIATDVWPGELRAAVTDPGGGSMMTPPSGNDPLSAPPKGAPTKRVVIPKKYQDAETSGLSYTISPTSAHVEIKMVSKPESAPGAKK